MYQFDHPDYTLIPHKTPRGVIKALEARWTCPLCGHQEYRYPVALHSSLEQLDALEWLEDAAASHGANEHPTD